jgi:hypothetical protein
MPPGYPSGFSRFICNSQGAKRSRFGLLGCITVDIIPPGDLKIFEPCYFNFLLQLCFQQSTGNSTCPEVKIVPGAVRNRFLDQDVGDL